ncbi:MAG: hypothetical protein WBM90_09980 [Acidimicrobiia bacterium]
MRLTTIQSDFVERVGRWWEQLFGSRTAGRILAWLMICEPAYQSSQQIVDALHTSAGSVSTQTRYLEGFGLVEKVTFPTDRATYYQFRSNAWLQMMWSEHQRIGEMLAIANAGEQVLPDDRPDRVLELRRMSEFLLAEWPDLMERLADYLKMENAK